MQIIFPSPRFSPVDPNTSDEYMKQYPAVSQTKIHRYAFVQNKPPGYTP